MNSRFTEWQSAQRSGQLELTARGNPDHQVSNSEKAYAEIWVDKMLTICFIRVLHSVTAFLNQGCTLSPKTEQKTVLLSDFSAFFTAAGTKTNAVQVLLWSDQTPWLGDWRGMVGCLSIHARNWGVLYSEARFQGLSCCYGDSTATLTKCEITPWSALSSQKPWQIFGL